MFGCFQIHEFVRILQFSAFNSGRNWYSWLGVETEQTAEMDSTSIFQGMKFCRQKLTSSFNYCLLYRYVPHCGYSIYL